MTKFFRFQDNLEGSLRAAGENEIELTGDVGGSIILRSLSEKNEIN